MQGTAFITGAKGLYYNRNRFYSPTLCRFTTRDPNETGAPIITALVMNAQSLSIIAGGFDGLALYGNGMNLFQYVGANPINRTDPTGMWSLLETAVTAGKYAGQAAVVAWQASRVLGAAYAVVGALQYLDGVTLLATMWMFDDWSDHWTQYAHNAIAQGNKQMITGTLLLSGGWAAKVAGRALTQATALLALGSGATAAGPESVMTIPNRVVHLFGTSNGGAAFLGPNGTAYVGQMHMRLQEYLHSQGLWNSLSGPGQAGWYYGIIDNTGRFTGSLIQIGKGAGS